MTKLLVALIGVLALMGIVALPVLVGGGTATPTPQAGPRLMTQTEVCHAAEHAIEAALKTPRTRKWVGTCYNGAGYRFTTTINAEGLPVWTVIGQVDAENEFGALIRSTWQVTVVDMGGDDYTAGEYVTQIDSFQ